MLAYLVDWGNGYIGGFTKDFDQLFNIHKLQDRDGLWPCDFRNAKVITPEKLDELRGTHKPTLRALLTQKNERREAGFITGPSKKS